ncbi:MAG: alpha/beta hydrolase [Chloroflexota bacterium]
MNWLAYWPFVEMTVILAAVAYLGLRLWRSSKQRQPAPRPDTFGGRVRFAFAYILRLLGFTLGVLLGLTLFVMAERSMVTLVTEIAPAPSQVDIPPDLGFEVEEVTFEGGDGLTMAGWYVPAQNEATVILLHGYGGNRIGMAWHARQLVQAGYGVLLYDERASGESEGDHRSYGWEDPRDVDGALRYLSLRGTGGRVGMAGCSSGADIALHTAALNPAIDAVWADGASTIRAQDLPAPQNPWVALLIAGNYTLDWMYQVRLGIEPPRPLIELLPQIAPRPILLVGGGMERPLLDSEGDLFTLRYAQIAGPNARAWVIPEATHCDGPLQRPEEYAARLVAFFDQAFGIER